MRKQNQAYYKHTIVRVQYKVSVFAHFSTYFKQNCLCLLLPLIWCVPFHLETGMLPLCYSYYCNGICEDWLEVGFLKHTIFAYWHSAERERGRVLNILVSNAKVGSCGFIINGWGNVYYCPEEVYFAGLGPRMTFRDS